MAHAHRSSRQGTLCVRGATLCGGGAHLHGPAPRCRHSRQVGCHLQSRDGDGSRTRMFAHVLMGGGRPASCPLVLTHTHTHRHSHTHTQTLTHTNTYTHTHTHTHTCRVTFRVRVSNCRAYSTWSMPSQPFKVGRMCYSPVGTGVGGDTWTDEELAFFRTLDTPMKIQDYLDTIPMNQEVLLRGFRPKFRV